jgi:hypothetical protein
LTVRVSGRRWSGLSSGRGRLRQHEFDVEVRRRVWGNIARTTTLTLEVGSFCVTPKSGGLRG